MINSFDVELIAPCGMNCGICIAQLRAKNTCPGCRIIYASKPKTRANCRISHCSLLSATDSGFCYDCSEYPCERLKQLDKRYRTKYNMSMIENLDNIKSLGLGRFLQNEQERWRCHNCGGLICVHRGFCLNCEGKQKMN
jgi:hypothetical protein